jgi:UDPglucose--hexose-1-phosphate uridylyltransferase
MAEMSTPAIEEIVGVWQQQTLDLGRATAIEHVLCFENKGEVVGVSNPHPHGQIYATNFVFKTTETEVDASRRYLNETGHLLFNDIILAEQKDGRRVLYEDEYTIAFVPYFARYAYEVYLAPKRRVAHIYALHEREVVSLAQALKAITVRYDNLWQMSFPYVLSLHQAPTDGADYSFYHFFLGFLPPLRRPTVQKFLAGPEIGGGNFISDTRPEEKAAELLAVSTTHYKAQREGRT